MRVWIERHLFGGRRRKRAREFERGEFGVRVGNQLLELELEFGLRFLVERIELGELRYVDGLEQFGLRIVE